MCRHHKVSLYVLAGTESCFAMYPVLRNPREWAYRRKASALSKIVLSIPSKTPVQTKIFKKSLRKECACVYFGCDSSRACFEETDWLVHGHVTKKYLLFFREWRWISLHSMAVQKKNNWLSVTHVPMEYILHYWEKYAEQNREKALKTIGWK